MVYEHFRNGINLGGWLSQYDCLNPAPQTKAEMEQHLNSYIIEDNIAQIASWGFDHVRLPVDYRMLQKTEESLADCEQILDWIGQCMDWCETYHLNLILDLHHAEGNVYGMMEAPMPLLTEQELRQKFIGIWRMLTERFKGRSTPVLMFELLNEVSDGSGYLWNQLYKETIQAIHSIDPDRFILVGSNEQNSPFWLKELELLDDDCVFYNFHFYDPQVFTHQQAHFSEEMMLFDRKIHYPDEITDFTGFLMKNRRFLSKYAHVAMEQKVGFEEMKALLKDAFDFVKYSGKELYCGEFGVIDVADPKDAADWINDVRVLLDENQIGHALWNYKELDFGLVDLENQVKSEERLKLVIEKK